VTNGEEDRFTYSNVKVVEPSGFVVTLFETPAGTDIVDGSTVNPGGTMSVIRPSVSIVLSVIVFSIVNVTRNGFPSFCGITVLSSSSGSM
jgi:hypothetical protein